MLQHVPVVWENANPVIDTADVHGVPDALFRAFFSGHCAYAALLACDKLGLSPDSVLFRSRAAFDAAPKRVSIEAPRLDDASQAAIRFIMQERRRHMLFVQLYSVRRALVETGTVGPLWNQRQRLMTGKDPRPLNPPPPVEWNWSSTQNASSSSASPGASSPASRQRNRNGNAGAAPAAASSAALPAPPQDLAQRNNSEDVVDDITAMIEKQQQNLDGTSNTAVTDDASSVAVNVHSPPRSRHPPWPAVPEPAPLYRWRTREVLDGEEKLLAETCVKLVQYGTSFLVAEQSRLHEQLTKAQQQHSQQLILSTANSRPSTRGGQPSTQASPGSRMGLGRGGGGKKGGGDDDDDYSSPDEDCSPSSRPTSSRIVGLEHLRRPATVGGRPTTAGTSATKNTAETVAQLLLLEETTGARGGRRKHASALATNANSAHLWQLGESPFCVAGVRPPRPPTMMQPLVTKFGKQIDDEYVSTTVQRHLRVIAKRAAEEIASTVHLNERDDEIREEMEHFMAGRKAKVTAPYMGRGFVDGETALNESIFGSDGEQQTKRKPRVEYEAEMRAEEMLEKMRERHERQEERLVSIDERKAVARALGREAELVRRENIRHNRARVDHVETARRLVIQASRAGRHERVQMLREQHRAAAWNSRVSHEMEAMIRNQVKDRVQAMQLTRRWELDVLPTGDDLADVFHSHRVVGEWQQGMRRGLETVEKAIEYETDPSVRRAAVRQQNQPPSTMSPRPPGLETSNRANDDNSNNGTVDGKTPLANQTEPRSAGSSINATRAPPPPPAPTTGRAFDDSDSDRSDSPVRNGGGGNRGRPANSILPSASPLDVARQQQQQRKLSGSVNSANNNNPLMRLSSNIGGPPPGTLPQIRPATGDATATHPLILHQQQQRGSNLPSVPSARKT